MQEFEFDYDDVIEVINPNSCYYRSIGIVIGIQSHKPIDQNEYILDAVLVKLCTGKYKGVSTYFFPEEVALSLAGEIVIK